MNLQVDVGLANLLRDVIGEVLFTGRFMEDDEDRLMDLRDQLTAFVVSPEPTKES